jgi:hypothetical protein
LLEGFLEEEFLEDFLDLEVEFVEGGHGPGLAG